MRMIVKGPEPRSLTKHRKAEYSDFDNYTAKNDLREALVTEQRGLCCYCMGRIRPQTRSMKIEHWRSRSSASCEQLNYRNLLGACRGGEGRSLQRQHCDTRKGDRDLLWNPADPSHHIETRVRYELDGGIRSDEDEFDKQLGQVLNLNLPRLKNSRKGVLDGILEWWRREKARLRGPVPRSRLKRERDRRIGGTGELKPYSPAAVWWLDQRLVKISA